MRRDGTTRLIEPVRAPRSGASGPPGSTRRGSAGTPRETRGCGPGRPRIAPRPPAPKRPPGRRRSIPPRAPRARDRPGRPPAGGAERGVSPDRAGERGRDGIRPWRRGRDDRRVRPLDRGSGRGKPHDREEDGAEHGQAPEEDRARDSGPLLFRDTGARDRRGRRRRLADPFGRLPEGARQDRDRDPQAERAIQPAVPERGLARLEVGAAGPDPALGAVENADSHGGLPPPYGISLGESAKKAAGPLKNGKAWRSDRLTRGGPFS